MLQLRPTFSESWYRVVALRPKLRATAQISRQYYRGERWYVVRDPAGNQFHRLSDAAYRFIGLLDGRRTVGEAWDLVGGQLADDAPTQPEVIQILSQLYSANLIETDVTPDAQVLLRRHKMQVKRKMQGRLLNVLFPRIPLWDCDNFLVRWMPLMRVFLSRFGILLWLAVIGFAIFAIAPEWHRIKDAAKFTISPQNWMWLWAVFVVTKLIHELGHAFMCRRFGGEVHELGIMFLVFIPTPYVDASTAWGFPNKWHKILVGAGGMIFELFFAAICAFIWLKTDPTSLLSQLCYNAMFIASVSTVIFNANPLLRYDGYYMLSDVLEIPNLQRKSSEYTLGLIKRHVFRIKPNQPLPPPLQRFWLFTYSILSTAYRTFVMFAIIFMVTYQLPEEVRWAGLLMALGGVITWACVPIFKLFKYLTIEPELHRKRGRAWAFTLAVAVALVMLIGVIPFDLSVHAEGVVSPREERLIFASQPGFVDELRVSDGQVVRGPGKDESGRDYPGDVIAVLRDDQLKAQVESLQAEVRAREARVRQMMATDPAQLKIEQQELNIYRHQLVDAQRRQARLTLRAPISGQFVSPMARELPGRYVNFAQEIGVVRRMDEVLIKAALTQDEVALVSTRPKEDAVALVRLIGKFGEILNAKDYTLIPSSQERVVSPALTQAGGGAIPQDPTDPEQTKPIQPQFDLRVELANPQGDYVPGQRAYVKITLDRKPLMWQWVRRIKQLIQSSSQA